MNRYLKIFLSSALFFSAIISGYAQPTLVLSDATAPSESNGVVDFSVMDFTDITKTQFSINWDITELEFVAIASINNNNDLNLSEANIDFSDAANGNLVFDWEDPNGIGMTLEDGMNFFSIEFKALIAEGSSAEIAFSDAPTEIIIHRTASGNTNIYDPINVPPNNGTITATAGIPDVNFMLTPIDEPSVICRGDQLCYNLTTSNFDSILVMQYIIRWNGSVLEFNNLSDFGLEDLNKATFVVKSDDEDTEEIEPTDSIARISWFPNNSIEGLTNGISLPDGSSLVTLCFDVIGAPNSSTLIEITEDVLTPLDLKDINEEDLDLISSPQTVSVTDCASLISFSTSCQDIKSEETVCIDFTAANFTNINATKYTLIFNPDVLEFVNTENFSLSNLDASNITVNNGVLTLDWTGTSGETLPNGAALFSACFKAIGAIDSTSTLQFLDLAGSVIVTSASGQDLQPQFPNSCEIKILPPTIGLTIPMVSTPPNTDICLEITVENFFNIGHIEMPIEWDPTVIEFVDIKPTGLTGLTRDDFKLLDIADGRLELEEWDSPTPEGVTLPDGAAIFEICFRVVGDLGTASPVMFSDSDITPVFIQNANNQILDIESNNGNVTVETSGLVLSAESKVERRDNSFCVDIQTSNFNNIVSAGYAHLYDPAVLRFDSVQVTNVISNLSSDNIVSAEEGTIRVAWTADDPTSGTTIADGTTIYSLCFTAIGDLGACSNFRLDDIQDITTVESAGDDIGTFNNIKDICIDNFGMTLIDTLRPSCIGGDGQINLTVSGDPGENFLYFVTKDGAAFLTGEDVENDSIILTDLEEGIYSIRINSIVDVSKSEERTFNLTLSEADLPSIELGEDIDAGCVEVGVAINTPLDGSNFTLPPTVGSNLFTIEWTTLGTGQLDNATADNEITTAFAPGRYIFTVKMTDTGCEASDTINVDITPLPRVEVSPAGILGCTNSTLELGIELLDPNPNNVYLWTTNDGNIVSGETSFTPIVDQEGVYKFMALDTVNGCIGVDSAFVFVDTSKVVAMAGPDLEMGCDDAFIQLNGIGSTGAEVAWSTPDGSSIFYPDTDNQEEANVTRVGTYIFTVTNQINGCQETDTMMINADNSLPVARAADIAIIGCGADDVKLDGSESSQGDIFSYRWEDPNSQSISTEDTLRTAIEGEYLLIVVNEDNDNCISDTARVMVTVDKAEPQTSITEVIVLACQADCTPLPANVPDGDHFTYQWETNDGVLCGGEDTPIAMVQSVGVYTLIVKDTNNNCESSSASIVSDDGTGVTADPGPVRQLDCNNEVVTLDGRGSSVTETSIISWKTEDGTEISDEITANVMVAGEYTLEIMDTETGCNGIGKITVTESKEKPAAEAGDAPIVSGCEFPTGRRLDGTASDFGDNIAYAWSSTSGIIVGDTSITAPEIASPGTYILTVTNTSNGCFDIDEVIVESDVVIPVPNAGDDKELSCDDPELSLAGFSQELPGSTISWTTEDGNITGETDQLGVNIDAPGTYVLSITSSDGCEATDEVIVSSSIDAPEADAGQALTITCNNNLTINGSGTIGENIDISWTSIGGNIISGADTYTPEINRGGSYTLTVRNTENNCEMTSLVIVSDSEELPVADAGANQEICTNESVLSAVQPNGNYVGNWTTLEKSMVVSPSEANSMVADLTEGANTYIWTLSNETCGNFSTDTVIVNVPTFPIAEDDFFEIQPDQNFNTINLVENDQVNSELFNINILEEPTTAQLTDVGNGQLEFTSPARYFGTQQFQYEVCSAACSELCDIANVRVVVLPGADVDTTNTVPNAITPNGDGMNDILLIDELIFDAVDFPQSELIIFNRWGDVVYKASPYNNDWQGTASNGDELPEGTYYYILRLDIVEGDVMKGDITILR